MNSTTITQQITALEAEAIRLATAQGLAEADDDSAKVDALAAEIADKQVTVRRLRQALAEKMEAETDAHRVEEARERARAREERRRELATIRGEVLALYANQLEATAIVMAAKLEADRILTDAKGRAARLFSQAVFDATLASLGGVAVPHQLSMDVAAEPRVLQERAKELRHLARDGKANRKAVDEALAFRAKVRQEREAAVQRGPLGSSGIVRVYASQPSGPCMVCGRSDQWRPRQSSAEWRVSEHGDRYAVFHKFVCGHCEDATKRHGPARYVPVEDLAPAAR